MQPEALYREHVTLHAEAMREGTRETLDVSVRAGEERRWRTTVALAWASMLGTTLVRVFWMLVVANR